MDVGNVKKRELTEGGTVCPECGKRQAHTHLGWLEHMGFEGKGRNMVKKSGGILFTALHCDKCDTDSLIIRFEEGAPNKRWSEVQAVVWKLFGQEPHHESKREL